MRSRSSGILVALGLAAIAEIVLFVVVGRFIGFGLTILALVITSILGALLLRHEGVRAWVRFREVQAAGDKPGPHLSRAVVGLLAAVLLIVPGFLTDLVALALLIPPVRTLAAGGVAGIASRRLSSAVVGDLFGPRRVRVRAGRPHADVTDPLEGEIVDPR
jgi:UPF0716 protein FxsA